MSSRTRSLGSASVADAAGRPRRVALLGATGSIGVQALNVIAREPSLEVVALSVGSSVDELARLADVHVVSHVQVAAAAARTGWNGNATMHDNVADLLDACEPDLVLNAVVGAAGLGATEAALRRGVDVALANKESLVAGGQLVTDLALVTGARIVPVDSEHSAFAQCWGASEPDEVAGLVLTASGGPFFGRSRAQLTDVTVEQALAHPTWAMGGKISIDSATLMNKGLELIEACVLFGVVAADVEVVVNRHSIVHAMVRHHDGTLLAHLGWPDMRAPIAWALTWPRRVPVPARALDLLEMPPLEFAPPDVETFRALTLARGAAETGGAAPCVLNAANEVAVEAFLAGCLPFLSIAEVVEHVLEALAGNPAPGTFADVREVDATARECAHARLATLHAAVG